MSVVQLRPKAPFLYGWCGTEYSFQTPRWCGSMAEQLICNQQVVGSTPTTSSKRGKIPEWPKGADCKSVGTAFGGSNPPLPTKKESIEIPMLSFFCEREWMRYRVRKPRFAPLRIATAPLFTLHILVIPFVAFRSLYTNLPNAEAIHLIRIFGWIPNHLFRCWTLHYTCKHARSRSYTNPPLSK